MSTAASVTMAADSTQGEPQEETKKKKKSKSHKKYKKHKRRSSSSESSVDSDLDLDKEMHPISHYVRDREVLVQQLFKSITTAKLRAMLPEVLKPFSIEDLRTFCLEQLEVMSRKRILRILQGEDPENISSSSTEDESEDEKIGKKEVNEGEKEESSAPHTDAVTSASVSEAGTTESNPVSGAEEEAEEGVEGDEEGEEEAEEGTEEEEEVEEVEEEEAEEGEAEETEEETVEEIDVTEEEEEVEEKAKEEVEEEAEEEEGEEGEEGEEEETEIIEEIEEIEVDTGEEGTEEEIEYEEVEIEVEEEETEEEGEIETEEEKEEEGVPQGDVRKIKLKTKAAMDSSMEGSQADLQLHAEQDDYFDDATSTEKSKKAKLMKAAKTLQVSTSGVKPQPQIASAAEERRRVKLNREALLPAAGTTQARTVKASTSSGAKPMTLQPETRRTVKAMKRKSTEGDPLSTEASTSDGAGSREIVLSKNQMEILELEMRARAIKAMLKMHSS